MTLFKLFTKKNKKQEVKDNWIDSVFLEDITKEILSEITTSEDVVFDGPFTGDILDEIAPDYEDLFDVSDGLPF
jgi:hypothetical protein